jgi:hypothetical protein
MMRQFPMDQMPANMRDSFEQKIRERLTAIGEGASLEIRDADTQRVMASY